MPVGYREDPWGDPRYRPEDFRHVRPPYHQHESMRGRAHGDFLRAGENRGEGLHRSRSQGHNPAPNVYIYNTMDQEANPYMAQDPRMQQDQPPRGRAHFLGDDLEDLLNAAGRSRSRSRGRSDAAWPEASPGGMWEHNFHELREKELRARMEKDREEELLRKNLELKYMRETMDREEAESKARLEAERRRKDWELQKMHEAREREEEEERIRRDFELRQKKREEEEERIRKEYETRRLKEEAKRKQEEEEREEEQKRAVEKYLREKTERERLAKEAQRRALEEHEREQREAKEEEKRIIAKLKAKEIEREEEEKRQWNEFLMKQRQMEEKEKRERKEKEDEIQEEMRKRLAEVGFQNNQIDVMIDPKHRQSNALVPGSLPNNPLHVHTPTYVKVHKDHLSIETLKYFDIPWEWDRVCILHRGSSRASPTTSKGTAS
jgi:hypothetical protein